MSEVVRSEERRGNNQSGERGFVVGGASSRQGGGFVGPISQHRARGRRWKKEAQVQLLLRWPGCCACLLVLAARSYDDTPSVRRRPAVEQKNNKRRSDQLGGAAPTKST